MHPAVRHLVLLRCVATRGRPLTRGIISSASLSSRSRSSPSSASSAIYTSSSSSQIVIRNCLTRSNLQHGDHRSASSAVGGYHQIHLSTQLYGEITSVKVPPLAESISEGDIRWEKAVGDSVAADEDVAFVETDKTSVPIKSPAAGVITELLVEDGATVSPGQEILKLEAGAAGAAPAAKPAPAAETSPPPAAASAPPPSSVPPPPPRATPAPAAPAPPKAAAAPPQISTDRAPFGTRSEQRVKMNRMRLRIAQRLKDAQNTYAMLTTLNEIDMSNVIQMRNAHKDGFLKKHGVKLGFMSAFVRAAAYALQDQPVVNAVIDENEIIYRDYVDISVAVSSPKGLVVPVLRNVETMSFADIEKGIAILGDKAKNNQLAIEDMDGGTFTISNGGVFGSLMGTPIINPPQSSILGMHGIFERPVAVAGKVEIRPMMYVALTYDHRLIDGREAVTFLRKIKSAVEDPRVILLDI